MGISMHAATVPLCTTLLGALSKVLDKGAAFAEAKKIDPAVLINARLAPDMFALARQVQIASDTAKGAAARLTGSEVPSWADSETSFDQLKARIAKTIDFVGGFSPAQFEGSESRTIVLKMRSGDLTFTGETYLFQFVIPNFTFHCTTAYDILRHNGVEIGKMDFLGGK